MIGDDRVISAHGRFTRSFTVEVESVASWIAWRVFGVIRPDLLHDACGANGEYVETGLT